MLRREREGDETHIGRTHDAADLLHRVQVWAQTTVHGEDLLVDDGGNGQAVETVRKRLPQLDVVPALALVVEAINAVDGGALVVATQDEEVFGVLDLVGQQQADGLERLLSTVDVVTEEEVVGLRGEAAILEQPQQVVVLTVDVATDLFGVGRAGSATRRACRRGSHKGQEERERWTPTYLDRCLKLEENGLGDEDLASLGAQISNLGLEQLDLLAGAAAADLQKTVDYGVQVDIIVICHGDYVGRQGLAWWWQRGEEGWTRRRGGGLRCGGTGFYAVRQVGWIDALL